MSTRSQPQHSNSRHNHTGPRATSFWRTVSNSPTTTLHLGRRLGAQLRPGVLLALQGELGAGKTTFAQGIAQGLGITQPLTSPTFTFVNEYRLSEYEQHEFRQDEARQDDRAPHTNLSPIRSGLAYLYHIDLYRLPPSPSQARAEAATFGLDEIFDELERADSDVAAIIEWAERLGDALPSDHLRVEIAHADGPDRPIESQVLNQATPDRRTLTFTPGGPRSRALLEALQND